MAPRNTMPSVKGIDALKAAFNRFIALSLMPAQMIELKNTQLFADGLRLHRGLLRAIDTDMTACAPQHDAIAKMRWSKRYFRGWRNAIKRIGRGRGRNPMRSRFAAEFSSHQRRAAPSSVTSRPVPSTGQAAGLQRSDPTTFSKPPHCEASDSSRARVWSHGLRRG